MFYRSLSADRAGPRGRGVHLRTRQGLRTGHQGTRADRCWPTSTPTCARRSPPGLGLPAPKGKPGQGRHRVSRRWCRSLAEPGPIDGRKIGIIADAGSDLAGYRQVGQGGCRPRCHRTGDRAGRRRAEGGPPHGHRRPDVGHDAVHRVRRARRGGGTTPTVTSNSSCCCRRPSGTARRIAAWGDGAAVLKAARIPVQGTRASPSPRSVDKAFTANLAAALGLHRAWDRAPEGDGIGGATRELTEFGGGSSG